MVNASGGGGGGGSTYLHIDTAIYELKRAAINAVMRYNGYEGEALSGWVHIPEKDRAYPHGVTGVNGDLSGGGEHYNQTAGTYTDYGAVFDDIRAKVDPMLDRWRELPDPEVWRTASEHLERAVRLLNVGRRMPSDYYNGTAGIGTRLYDIHQTKARLRGAIMKAFRNGFIDQLGPKVNNVCEVVVVLGGAAEMQAAIWTEAVDALATNVDKAIAALDAVAEGGGDGFAGDLNGMSLGLGVVSLFGGPVGWVAGAGSLGLSVLSVAGVGAPEVDTGPTADSILDGLAQLLDEADKRLEQVEGEINDNLSDNLSRIYTDPTSCVLVPPRDFLSTDDATEIFGGKIDAIKVDGEEVRDITDKALFHIGRDLGRAAGAAGDGYVGFASWTRSSGLGLDPYGPAHAWNEMQGLVEPWLRDMQWSVEASADHLAYAINELRVLDDEIAGTLKGHTRRIVEGSGIDPVPERETRPFKPGDQPPTV